MAGFFDLSRRIPRPCPIGSPRLRRTVARAHGTALACSWIMQTSHQPARQSLNRVSIRHILCPVDLSETSERALEHARALGAWYDADITVVEAIWVALPPI